MSQFSFETDVNTLLRLDAPISSGPLPRWQRKAASANAGNLSMPAAPGTHNNSSSIMAMSPNKGSGRNTNPSRTPGRTPTSKCQGTPGAKGKSTPGTKGKNTPGRGPRTPHGNLGDRFIPVRNNKNMEVASYLVSRENPTSPLKEKQAAMMHLLSGVDVEKARILQYQGAAPPVPEGYSNKQKVLYSHQGCTPMSLLKKTRHIPTQPERVLDAPAVRNDFYLNPLDWSVANVVCVSLGHFGTYLWDAVTGDVTPHMKLKGNDYASSVSWMPTTGNVLAIGTSMNTVEIWDVERNKRLRNMKGHTGRVSTLAWNGHILSSGSRSGEIYHHDVRVVQHHVSTLSGHSQEVCGLAWSPGGRILASGSNDNNLLLWANGATTTAPLHSLQQHTAAVKALAWCPWQSSLLASGGGTNDHHIRLWNVNNGVCLNAVDAKSQVCSVLWSSEHKELLSAHGYSKNQLTLWSYPTMVPIAELLGHTGRVLQVVASPDGSSVMSIGADESLRLWRCFQVDETRRKKQQSGAAEKGRLFHNYMR